MTSVLLERDAHLDLLTVALEEAQAGTGRLVWLEGAAGVGKTALFDAAVRRAEAAGMGALVAVGDEFETDLAWGVVFQLFERPLRRLDDEERAAAFRGPARLAAPLLHETTDAAALDEPALEDDARLGSSAVNHGLHWLVANLAEARPMLVAVDDLQWCDASSLAFLGYLARRVRDLPVVLLLASRTGVDNATSRRRERLRREPSAHRITPPALSPAAVEEIVRVVRPGATEALCRAAHRATSGNPFLVKIVEALVRDHPAASDAAIAQRLKDLGSDDLLHEVDRRLLDLPGEAAAFARALALMGTAASATLVGELAGLTAPRTPGVVDELQRGEWVEPDPAAAERGVDAEAPTGPVDGDRTSDLVRFRHPLIRAAVHALLGPEERDRLHARAADLLVAAGHPPEEVVPHLLASAPRGRADHAVLLAHAADRARRSGAPAQAVTMLRRALAEPPAAELVGELHRALARSGAAANAPDVDVLFADAVAHTDSPAARARLHLHAGRALATQGRYAQAVEAIEQAMVEDDGGDERFTAELDAAHLVALRMDPARRRDWRPRLEALAATVTAGGGPVAHALAAELAYERGVSGRDLDAARRLALASVEGDAGTSLAFANPMAWATAMHALNQVNEFARAAEVADAVVRAAQETGSRATFVLGSSYLALHCLRLGRLTDARSALGAIEPDASASAGVFVPLNAATMSQLLLLADRLDEARAALVLPGDAGHEQELTFVGIPEAAGWLDLAQDDPAGALARFEKIAVGVDGVGASHPSTTGWRSGAARALARLGDAGAARALADEELALAREWGAPRPLARALTTAGLVRPGRAGHRFLDEAVAVVEGSQAVPERIEALLERGRRAGELRAAGGGRDDLRAALDLAHRAGAERYAAQAEEALRAGGARPRTRAVSGLASLTPSELRVARLAAAGRRNNDIAAELFVSRKAVEYHLSNVYRKLHLDGRRGLAAALEDAT